MVHVPFDVQSVGYDDHVLLRGAQYGGSADSEGSSTVGGASLDNNNGDMIFPYFRGIAPYQRGFGAGGGVQIGAGIGDILRGLWRMLLPVVRRAGTSAARELLSTSEKVLDKVNKGENLKQAVISEGKKAVKDLLEKGGLEAPPQLGSGGTHKSSARGRKRGHQHHHLPFGPDSHQIIVGRRAIGKPPPASFSKSFLQKAPSKKRSRVDTFGLY